MKCRGVISFYFCVAVAIGHANDASVLNVHQTKVQGLNTNEMQMIRTDLIVKRDGDVIQSGYYSGCVTNDESVYEASLFNRPGTIEHYEYSLKFSLCHSLEDARNNRCTYLSQIYFTAVKNEIDEVIVDLPEYLLDLKTYAGAPSICTEDSEDISVIKVKRNKYGSYVK